jgi:hypothetical protein
LISNWKTELHLLTSTVGGVSAAISKTGAAPIERVKLLMQNQARALIFSTSGGYSSLSNSDLRLFDH